MFLISHVLVSFLFFNLIFFLIVLIYSSTLFSCHLSTVSLNINMSAKACEPMTIFFSNMS